MIFFPQLCRNSTETYHHRPFTPTVQPRARQLSLVQQSRPSMEFPPLLRGKIISRQKNTSSLGTPPFQQRCLPLRRAFLPWCTYTAASMNLRATEMQTRGSPRDFKTVVLNGQPKHITTAINNNLEIYGIMTMPWG